MSNNIIPTFAPPGSAYHGDHSRYRSILEATHDPALDQALADFDAAMAYDTLADVPVDPRDVEAQYRAEELAAALEHRTARIGWADVQAAQAAQQEHRARQDANRQALDRRRRVLTEAIRWAGGTILHPLAVARARALGTGEELRGSPRHPVEELYQLIVWPPLAYGPAVVTSRYELDKYKFWPAPLAGWDEVAWQGSLTVQMHDYAEWAWAQLARPKRKGYTITGAGELQFSEVWEPPQMSRRRTGMVAYAQSSFGIAGEASRQGLQPGDLVMYGTGPNGEQGATDDDMARRFVV